MRGGSKPGERRGGRKAGTPNKVTSGVADKLKRWKCDPFHILAKIAMADLICGTCHGKKRRVLEGDKSEVCGTCYGSGKEPISAGEMARAAGILCEYIEAKRKVIEVSGEGGGPIEIIVHDAGFQD